MQITLTGRKMDLTDSLHSHTNSKVGKITKFLDRPIEARVVLSVEKQRHSAEVTIIADGFVIHTKEITDDMYASIDKVADKAEKLAKKHKERLISRTTRKEPRKLSLGTLDEAPLEAEGEPGLDDNLPKIIREPNLNKKPMSEEDAVELLRQSGDEFIMFRNAQSDEVNVLYKKHGLNFGLLTP